MVTEKSQVFLKKLGFVGDILGFVNTRKPTTPKLSPTTPNFFQLCWDLSNHFWICPGMNFFGLLSYVPKTAGVTSFILLRVRVSRFLCCPNLLYAIRGKNMPPSLLLFEPSSAHALPNAIHTFNLLPMKV